MVEHILITNLKIGSLFLNYANTTTDYVDILCSIFFLVGGTYDLR